MDTRSFQRTLYAGLALLLAVGLAAALSAAPKAEKHFRALLLGDNEVPPRATAAFGAARLKIDPHDRWLDISVQVSEINNVVAAHIHIAPPGVNGPIAVGLYEAPQAGGPFQGELADLRIFPGDVAPAFTWAQLLAAMRAGNTYVNVHTNDGAAPPNTGPGDFPGGEVRGQLLPK